MIEDVTNEENQTQPATEEPKETAHQESSEKTESKDPTSLLMEQIAELQEQSIQHKDQYMRARADLENYRKRTLKDREDLKKTANMQLIENLISILDNFKLGLDSVEENETVKKHVEGFHMIFDQFNNTLTQEGLEPINPEGSEFNPNEHESIAQQASEDIADNHIIQVVRTGYKLNSKLLRPASVIVSSGPESQSSK